MREREIEAKLVREVRRLGGMCPKWVSPGLDGVPDRIVLLPGGRIAFVEVKAPGCKPRPLQVKVMRQLTNLGFQVYVLDDEREIGKLLDEVERGGGAS